VAGGIEGTAQQLTDGSLTLTVVIMWKEPEDNAAQTA
jgi:hypothetical protein